MVIESWRKWYKKLVKFRDKTPNRWPIRRGRETKLAAWCSRQRSSYHKGGLSKDVINKLNYIGFPWVSIKNNFDKWLKSYKEVVKFKKKFPEKGKWPHARLKNPKYIKLGKWVGYQRALYKKNKLEKRKMNLLKKIGFDFEPTKKIDDRWMKKYNDSLAYYNRNGRWPPRINPRERGIKWGHSEYDLDLGNWCDRQIRSKRRGSLSKSKIDLLNKANFDWKENKVLNYNNETWEQKFHKLKKFWKKNPGKNPQPYNPKENELHNFWKGQKRSYNSGSLTPYRFKKLKEIGFSFHIRRYGKHAGTSEWDKIISKGENDRVEFKSSLRWDYKQNTTNMELEYPVVKAVCALLNAKGGYLFIGINDQGKVLGLKKDYSTLGRKQNEDSFLLQLNNLIDNCLEKGVQSNISPKIENIRGEDVCVVIISCSDKEVFLNYKGREEFCIRGFNSSQVLGPKQTVEYIRKHWKE